MFERLTADKVYLNSIRFGIQVNFPPHCGHEKAKEVDDFVKNVFDRLAAYEDSGLSPEEVQELKVSVKICEDCWSHAQAKAEGRLVVLPETGIGDLSDGYHTLEEIIKAKIDQITREIFIFENEVEIKLNDYLDIKDAYPTHEAAEKVLPTCNVTKLPCAGCNPVCEHREE